MSSPSTIAPDTSTSPVSWQTIFWTLIPLAIAVMTQPAGRVCGAKSRYRVFLRCSPIICAADSISIITRFIIYTWKFKTTPKQSIHLLLRDRFNNPESEEEEPEEDESADGPQALKKFTLLRWAFFVLGTLFPAIKLAAMGGIPWTKTWGLMFLTSFFMVEILIIMSWYQTDEQPVEQGLLLDDDPDTTFEKTDDSITNYERIFLLAVACVIHLIFLLKAFLDLWPQPHPDASNTVGYFKHSDDPALLRLFHDIYLVLPVITVLSLSYGLFIGAICYLLHCVNLLNDWSLERLQVDHLWFCLITLITSSLAFVGFAYGWMVPLWVMIDFVYPGIFLTLMFFIPNLCEILCIRFPKVARNLFLPQKYDSEEADKGACYCLLLCIYSFVSCICWYAYCYSSVGTSNPSWTGIFG